MVMMKFSNCFECVKFGVCNKKEDYCIIKTGLAKDQELYLFNVTLSYTCDDFMFGNVV